MNLSEVLQMFAYSVIYQYMESYSLFHFSIQN
jgi:hypothetical protein